MGLLRQPLPEDLDVTLKGLRSGVHLLVQRGLLLLGQGLDVVQEGDARRVRVH